MGHRKTARKQGKMEVSRFLLRSKSCFLKCSYFYLHQASLESEHTAANEMPFRLRKYNWKMYEIGVGIMRVRQEMNQETSQAPPPRWGGQITAREIQGFWPIFLDFKLATTGGIVTAFLNSRSDPPPHMFRSIPEGPSPPLQLSRSVEWVLGLCLCFEFHHFAALFCFFLPSPFPLQLCVTPVAVFFLRLFFVPHKRAKLCFA